MATQEKRQRGIVKGETGESFLEAWQDHEHLSAQLELDAQRLLADAGTPELAKFAIDAVDRQRRELAREDFAHDNGFTSYEELCDASICVANCGEDFWFVTSLSDGRWLGWSYAEFADGVKLPSREAAMEFVAKSASNSLPE